MTALRETNLRVFSTELNSASFEIKSDEEMKPSHQLSRLGLMINRVLIVGVLTEKENIGTEDEPMWRGRMQDIPGGTVFINIGRYQPDAANSIRNIDTPSLVAVIGKVKSYTNEEMRTFVSVRPERIFTVSEETRRLWLLETSKDTWKRMTLMKKASQTESPSPEAIQALGIPRPAADSISMALDQYGMPESTPFLKAIESGLRMLLPERNVDFGLPGDVIDEPEEVMLDRSGGPSAAPKKEDAAVSADREQTVLDLLKELDNGKGAPRDELESRCADMGIPSMDLDEVIEGLLDKGLAYEPNLKYIKRIDDRWDRKAPSGAGPGFPGPRRYMAADPYPTTRAVSPDATPESVTSSTLALSYPEARTAVATGPYPHTLSLFSRTVEYIPSTSSAPTRSMNSPSMRTA